MSDIFSLVCHAVSRVLCNHSNRGRFRNAHYLVTVSITQKSVPPLSKITLQFIVYLTVSNKYNCKFCFLCTFNMSLNTHFRCFTRFLSSLCFPVSNEHHGSFSTLSTSPSYSHHNSSHLPPQGSIHCHSGILVLYLSMSCQQHVVIFAWMPWNHWNVNVNAREYDSSRENMRFSPTRGK